MLGAVLIVVVLLVVLPVFFMLLGTILAVLTSWSMTNAAEAAHEGSPLTDLNR